MNFDSFMPVRLITGRGCVGENASLLRALGDRCLIVTSGSAASKSGALADMAAALKEQGIEYRVFDRVRQNPLLADALEAGRLAREWGARFIVGIGGGSPLDTAKAAAVYAVNEMELMDIFKAQWENPALPLVLVGTTAGTGSEVAPYAVMTTPEGLKQSVASEQLYAAIAFGDAKYTDSLPLGFTVSTALDALSHALEGYFGMAATAVSDLYAIEAVRILLPELAVLMNTTDASRIPPQTRDRLYYASVLAGFTLARCGTCYCHALGYFLSEEHGIPHGTACAVFLPHYLARAERLMPEKAAFLMERAGCTRHQLTELVDSLLDMPRVTLTSERIEEIVGRNVGSKGFLRTAPAGFTHAEGVEVMTALFGA